jgi:transcriptional regulator with XRE-family HTH domain
MNSTNSFGACLRRLRGERGLKQRELAERAGLAPKTVQLIEAGERLPSVPAVYRLADALGVDPSRMFGKRERLGRAASRGILAVRDAILPPQDLPGIDTGPDGEPAPLERLERGVDQGWELYWQGQFAMLALLLPPLLTAARASERQYGTPACRPLAQAYQLAADLMVHTGDDSTAFTAAARAVRAAHRGGDPLQHATLAGTASWVLLHQGRLAEAQAVAEAGARAIAPSGSAPLPHLCVYGALLLSAAAPAAAAGDRGAVDALMTEAQASALPFTADRHDYQVSHGRSQIAMQRAHQQQALGEPAKALKAAAMADPADLLTISRGALLLDVAGAHLRMRTRKEPGWITLAGDALYEAWELSPNWAPHQGPWRAMVAELRQAERTASERTEMLAEAAGLP